MTARSSPCAKQVGATPEDYFHYLTSSARPPSIAEHAPMASHSPAPRATDTAEIGRTGLRVSRLGLGGVALSGAPPATDPQRPTPEDEGVALIRRSLPLGLT